MNATNISSQSLVFSNPIINNILIAIIIFFLGLIIGRIAGRLVTRIIKQFEIDSTVKKRTGVKTSFSNAGGNIVSFIIYFVFLIIALNYVGITSLLLNIISIILIIVLAISAFMGVKESVPNMVGARKIRKTVSVGDKIKIGTVEGHIEAITALETRILTKKGDLIHIPNSLFLKEKYTSRKSKRKNK